jgi:hypothetical protein
MDREVLLEHRDHESKRRVVIGCRAVNENQWRAAAADLYGDGRPVFRRYRYYRFHRYSTEAM